MSQINTLPEGGISEGDDCLVSPGALDGVTIMRYAHVDQRRVSGGVEQYLRQLDRGLLEKHRLTVLQMHLMKDEADDTIAVEDIGIGRILWVPVAIRQAGSRLVDLPRRIAYICKQTRRRSHHEGKGQAILSALHNLARHRGGHLRYRTAILSDHLPRLLATHKVDLLALHWATYDTDALVLNAFKAKIPFVFINHFDNRRFLLSVMRKWAPHAAAIGAVSGRGIPDNLQGRCVNLSDAVDTVFFAPEKARPVPMSARPLVLLPGRIDVGKGHHDLIKAARILMDRKLDLDLCFAGAVDSEPLHQEIRRAAVALEMSERIVFLGEKSAEDMRELYAQSSFVVLPSYSEGLGRVLLEAQAMEKPVVAYDCGGMSEAILPNKTGFLVKTGDVEALANKISLLLQNEAERRRLGKDGREFVSQRFSVPALVQRHEAFYLRALSTRRRNGTRSQ
jgi:glycosyltransferase involved in cell wall biosynthesis